ncbi:hypothetical protein Tco_1254484 [Tanacetum coccineum]
MASTFGSKCPEYIPTTVNRLENRSPTLDGTHLAAMQPTQINKITTSCEICSGPDDTYYCMEDPEQAFVEYASSRTDEAEGYCGILSSPSKQLSDDKLADTPFVSPFPHSDNDSDDGEVLIELVEYENVRILRREKAINSFDEDDLAFQCMIGFRKFVAYFDPFLPMNVITRKAYNTIRVEGLESIGKNLVDVVRDVYVFVGSFTYIIDFVVLEDIGEFIQINKAKVVMGKPFRKITKLEYDCAKGLMSFNRIFDNDTFQMSCTIPRLYLMRRRLEDLRMFSLNDSWRTI